MFILRVIPLLYCLHQVETKKTENEYITTTNKQSGIIIKYAIELLSHLHCFVSFCIQTFI